MAVHLHGSTWWEAARTTAWFVSTALQHRQPAHSCMVIVVMGRKGIPNGSPKTTARLTRTVQLLMALLQRIANTGGYCVARREQEKTELVVHGGARDLPRLFELFAFGLGICICHRYSLYGGIFRRIVRITSTWWGETNRKGTLGLRTPAFSSAS